MFFGSTKCVDKDQVEWRDQMIDDYHKMINDSSDKYAELLEQKSKEADRYNEIIDQYKKMVDDCIHKY